MHDHMATYGDFNFFFLGDMATLGHFIPSIKKLCTIDYGERKDIYE
jgi:hypothetical protein